MNWAEKLKKMLYFQSNPAWYYFKEDDVEETMPFLTADAPPEAVESYNLYMKIRKTEEETGELIM